VRNTYIHIYIYIYIVWQLRVNVDFKCQNRPSTRCALVANAINSDNDIFSGPSVSAYMIGEHLILLRSSEIV